jgi:hypothetical protein
METRSRRQQLVIQFSCVNRGFINGCFVKGFLDRGGLNGSRLNRRRGN